MTDSTKSTWVQWRNWLLTRAHHVIDLLTPSTDALSKAIPDGAADKVKTIVEDGVTKAEQAGGTWQEKLAAAEASIFPALEAIGIQIARAALHILISNAVIALGFSAASL